MKIFVTGGSGFIGGAITKHLLQNHEVVAMARSKASAEKLMAMGANAVDCSLSNVKPDNITGCQAVVHAAALVSATGTRKEFWAANVEGTKRLLAAACLAGARRFIYISTEAVLFRGQNLIDIDESYPYPKKYHYLYPETKAAAEKLVLEANEPDLGFATIALRPRLVWGLGDQVILPTISQMARRRGFFWFDRGQARTSTTNIENVLHAVDLALKSRVNGQTFFITDDEEWTIKEFLTALAETQNLTLPDRSLPSGKMKVVGRFLGGIWRLFRFKSDPPLTEYAVAAMSADCTLNIDKARKELGYKPIISAAEGLEILRNGTN